MIVDYHMHLRAPRVDGSEPLEHSLEAVERFVERGRERGVDEIAFTEHVYYFEQTREIWTVPYQADRATFDLDDYCDVLVEARRRGLPVKLGLEVDYVGDSQPRLAELLRPYPFDLLLGSVHFIDGLEVDLAPGAWAVLPVGEVWRRYVSSVSALARSGAVDVLAHPDLAKIFGSRPAPGELAALEVELADAAARADIAVEVSSAGLRKQVREIYPDQSLLRACRERGVPITIASDAHESQLVGEDFDATLAHARAAGYDRVAVFDGRSRTLEPLG